MRDYKNYAMANAECSGKLGLAVAVTSVQTMFEHFGHEECYKAIESFMVEKNLSMFGIVCNVIKVETKEIRKYILLYTLHKDSFANSFDKLLDKIRAAD